MQAVQFDAPASDSSTTRRVELPTPEPGEGQLTIDVAYAGINFMDIMTRRGDPGYARNGWPLVPGLEVAGTVRGLGSGVTDFQVGERVAAMVTAGGLAEVVLADARLVAAVPSGLELSTAAAAPVMLSTAVLLLRDAAHLQEGERVFMHSASGGVGSVVPQVARALGGGMRVGTVASSAKLADATAAGWDDVFVGGGDLLATVRDRYDEGFGVILDPTGTESLDLDLQLTRPGARIVLFGNATGATPGPLPAFGQLLGGNVGLIGFSISGLSRTQPERIADALGIGLELLADGKVEPPVTVVDSLDGVGKVHDLLANRAGRGKYVVRVAG